jgi:hypothetical protein
MPAAPPPAHSLNLFLVTTQSLIVVSLSMPFLPTELFALRGIRFSLFGIGDALTIPTTLIALFTSGSSYFGGCSWRMVQAP